MLSASAFGSANNTSSTFIIPDTTKISSYTCLESDWFSTRPKLLNLADVAPEPSNLEHKVITLWIHQKSLISLEYLSLKEAFINKFFYPQICSKSQNCTTVDREKSDFLNSRQMFAFMLK